MKVNVRHFQSCRILIVGIISVLLIAGCNSGSKNKFWSIAKSNTENRLTKVYLNYINSISSSDFPINSFQSNSDLPNNKEFCSRIKTNKDLFYFPTTLWQMYSLNDKADWKKFALNYTSSFNGIDSSKIFSNGQNIQNLLLTPYLISGSQNYYSAMMRSLKTYLAETGGESERDSISVPENVIPISKLLENQLLFFAFNETGDPVYKSLALKNTDLIANLYFKNLQIEKFKIEPKENVDFRIDSCSLNDHTKIAYSDLAIGLYGFRYMYVETGIEKYRNLYRNIELIFDWVFNKANDSSLNITINSSSPKLNLFTQTLICLALIDNDGQSESDFSETSDDIYKHILDILENDKKLNGYSPSLRLFYYLFEYERKKQNLSSA